MVVVDTNILVYAADDEAPEHQKCRQLLERLRRQDGAWYLTWAICYEFLRVVTHPRVFRKPMNIRDANRFLAALQQSRALGILVPTDRHAAVLSEVIDIVPQLAGNLIHDAATAVLMKEHGIRTIISRDTDFHRFPFLECVDPLTAG